MSAQSRVSTRTLVALALFFCALLFAIKNAQSTPVSSDDELYALVGKIPPSCKPGSDTSDKQCPANFDYNCAYGTPADKCPSKKPGGKDKPCQQPAPGGQTIKGKC